MGQIIGGFFADPFQEPLQKTTPKPPKRLTINNRSVAGKHPPLQTEVGPYNKTPRNTANTNRVSYKSLSELLGEDKKNKTNNQL